MPELSSLQSLVETYTRKGGCSFYRNLYGLSENRPFLEIKTQDEWRALPYLTKEDLQKVPIEERMFVPFSDVGFIRSTSGTSGKPPLFYPFISVPQRVWSPRIRKGVLTSLPSPSTVLEHMFEKSLGIKVSVFLLDPRYMQASVRVALANGIDTLVLAPFLISAVATHMEEPKDREGITYVEFVGDRAGQEVINFTKEQFPNAFVTQGYGISEVGYISSPCKEATLEHPGDVYHGNESMYLEILDGESDSPLPLEQGVEGELVCTTVYEPLAFPMIRYRMGDIARVVESKCEEHGRWSFTVLGRKDMDFIKVPGGVLRVDEVERVLRGMHEKVTDEFELHYSEHAVAGGAPKIQATLHVEARLGVALSELADDIASKFRVGPSLTYAQGVGRGLYLPLMCSPLPKLNAPGKRKRLVRD